MFNFATQGMEMSTQEKKMQEDLIKLLFKKAGLNKSEYSRIVLKRWARNKVSLFSNEELIYFKSIFA